MNAGSLERIREKLDRLRRDDHGVVDLGEHGYREDPPLTERELADVEAEYEISFPEDFRQFLLHVLSGGAGPNYGL